MNKLKFRPLPNSTNTEIPFAPDEASYSEWLDALSSESGYVICRRMTMALQAMNNMDLNPRFRFDCLYRALPLVKEVAERLENVYLDSGFPLTTDEISSVETLVWTYTQLTMSFSDLSYQLELRNDDWATEEQAQVLYLAMYAASQVLLHVSQVYTDVQKGFWLNCYRIYSRSEARGLLDIPAFLLDIKNKTIDSIFKQMLIFACCDTDCFRVREMKTLYDLLGECVDLVGLSTTIDPERVRGIFGLNMDCDESPKKNFERIPLQNTVRYIDALPVVNFLITAVQQRKDKKSDYRFIDKELVFRVAEVLTKRHDRKYTRLSTSENAKGYIGFKPIVSVLAKIQGVDNETIRVKQMRDPRIAGKWEVPDLDLVPEGDEIAYNLKQKKEQRLAIDERAAKIHRLGALATSNKNIWSKPETIDLLDEIPSGDFLILNGSIKGYALIWNPEEQRIKVGELFAVKQQKDSRLEIGMIRRISRLKNESFKLGIELMGMKSELVWLIIQGINKQPGQMAILIPADPVLRHPDSIVLGSHHLKPEQAVEIHRGKEKLLYRVGRLLHVTAALQHFELVSSEGSSA